MQLQNESLTEIQARLDMNPDLVRHTGAAL